MNTKGTVCVLCVVLEHVIGIRWTGLAATVVWGEINVGEGLVWGRD